MIAGIVFACYGVAWMCTARLLYGRWRGQNPHARYCDKHGGAKYRSSNDPYGINRPPCCMDRAGWPDGTAALLAMTTALVWPIALITAVVRFRPPPTAAEQAAANAKLTAHIAELEHELHLGDTA